MKVKFKMCKQSQVAKGIVLSYFSQKEVNMSWRGEGLLGYFSTCTSSHSSFVKELSMKKRDWHVEKEVWMWNSSIWPVLIKFLAHTSHWIKGFLSRQRWVAPGSAFRDCYSVRGDRSELKNFFPDHMKKYEDTVQTLSFFVKRPGLRSQKCLLREGEP